MSATEWTVATLKEHLMELRAADNERIAQRFKDSQTAVDAALTAAGRAVDAALTSAKEAVMKAESASERRFEGVNEFRATLGDQQRTLMPRAEAELRMQTLESRVEALDKAAVAGRGQRVGMAQTWGFVVGAIGIALALASYFGK